MARVLGIDIGGTRSRAAWSTSLNGVLADGARVERMEAEVGDLAQLRVFVREALSAAGGERPAGAVVAVAGPVDGERVRVVNWPGAPEISLEALETAGLPPGGTRLLNDVVAGAYGMVARVQRNGLARFSRIGGPEASSSTLMRGHLIYASPGTGLGAAAMVRDEAGALVAVGCEMQHSEAPSFAPDVARVLERVRAERGKPASWEDVVSGRGLVAAYRTFGGDASSSAAHIAAAALTSDDIARRAMSVYYRTLGRFLQALALAHQPCAAAFVGGASTEANLAFMVEESGLAAEFRSVAEPAIAEKLADVPLMAIPGDPNLDGALWLAARLAG